MNWYKISKTKNKRKEKEKEKEKDKESEKDFMSISQYGQDAVNIGGNRRDSNDSIYLT